jgi:hypothetical protein
MKKIAILTFFKSGNFGGELQAYALQKKLRLMNYNVEVIHQLRPNTPGFKSTENFKPLIELSDSVSKKNKRNMWLAKKIDFIARIIFSKRFKVRNQKFLNFEEKHINLTKTIYYNFDELYAAKLNFDIFIVGSDQVWNYTNGFSSEPYFLTFAPKRSTKISYAASFGHADLPESIKDKYSKWLRDFDRISTREIQGERIVKEITSLPCQTVLDPTLVLSREEWDILFSDKPIVNEKYILIYTLVESKFILELSRRVATELGITKIIRLIPNCWTREVYSYVENVYDAGPIEFINYFRNASFVLTNSFHGTAFSVNFNIPFYTIPRENKKNNSRFFSLLELTNLENRIIFDGDKDFKLLLEVDFKLSNLKLQQLREESLNFLIDSIEHTAVK